MQITDLNRSVTSNEIEAVIKSPNKGKPRARWISHGALPELQGIHTNTTQIFHELEREGRLPNSL